jgi:glutathione S-transferase
MKLLLAESSDARHRIETTAAMIYVEERRRGTTWPAQTRDRVDRRLATASLELAAVSADGGGAERHHPRRGETARPQEREEKTT